MTIATKRSINPVLPNVSFDTLFNSVLRLTIEIGWGLNQWLWNKNLDYFDQRVPLRSRFWLFPAVSFLAKVWPDDSAQQFRVKTQSILIHKILTQMFNPRSLLPWPLQMLIQVMLPKILSEFLGVPLTELSVIKFLRQMDCFLISRRAH